jgi:hypothetical protein
MLKLHLSPKEGMPPTMLSAQLPFYLKEVAPLEQAQVIKHMKMMQSPPIVRMKKLMMQVSYGPPWAHYLGGYQDRLLGGPLGLPSLRYMASDGMEHKDYEGVVLG